MGRKPGWKYSWEPLLTDGCLLNHGLLGKGKACLHSTPPRPWPRHWFTNLDCSGEGRESPSWGNTMFSSSRLSQDTHTAKRDRRGNERALSGYFVECQQSKPAPMPFPKFYVVLSKTAYISIVCFSIHSLVIERLLHWICLVYKMGLGRAHLLGSRK